MARVRIVRLTEIYMGKILGVCTSVTGITITNSVENLTKIFDVCTIHFKVKSLLLHC